MNLTEYWPPYLRELLEFGALARAEQPELDNATEQVDGMARDFSAFTLTLYGIRRWERILGITGVDADTLEARRFRIQSRLMEQIPITKRTLYAQLQTLCGEDGFRMTIDPVACLLDVKVALTSKYALSDVDALVRASAPANLIASVSLLYNQYKTLARYTRGELAAHTRRELREEVLV